MKDKSEREKAGYILNRVNDHFIEYNGMKFDVRIEEDIIRSLLYAYKNKLLVRIYFGDKETGEPIHHLVNGVGRLSLESIYGYGHFTLKYKKSDVPANEDDEYLLNLNNVLKIELYKNKNVIYEHKMYNNDYEFKMAGVDMNIIVYGKRWCTAVTID